MLRGTVEEDVLRLTTRRRHQLAEWCLRLSRLAFVVTLVMLPSPAFWEVVPRQIGNLEPPYRSLLLYVSDIPLIVAVLAWAFAHLLAPAQRVQFGPWYIAGPCLTLLTLTVLSPLWAHAVPIALETAVRTVALFGFYLIAANDARASPLLAVALIVGLLANAPFAVVQFVTQGPAGLGALGEISWYETTPGAWLRGYGLSMHPNVLGGFLALGLLCLVGLGLRGWRGNPRLRREGETGFTGAGSSVDASPLALIPQPLPPSLGEGVPRSPSPKIGRGGQGVRARRFSTTVSLVSAATTGALVLGTVGLLSTFSRSAWLGLVGGLLYVGLLVMRHAEMRWLVHPLLGQVLILALVALAFTARYHSLVATRLVLPMVSIVRQDAVPGAQLELNVIEERNTLHEAAATLIAASPLVGVGAGNFTIAYYQQQGDRDPRRLYQPEHNVPLLVTAELGPLGGLAWLFLTVAPLIVLIRQSQRGKSIWPYLWGGAILAVLLISQFDFYFWGRQQGRALFWALLGVWVAAQGRGRITS